MNLNEKLQTLPKLFNSEYHYLIDTEEFELHQGILYEDCIILSFLYIVQIFIIR